MFYFLQNIIHSSGSVQDEMAHYLYVLQSITLNHLETRMMMPMDCYNQASSRMTCHRDILCFRFCYFFFYFLLFKFQT